VERLLSRGSGFLSDICRLYDAHFVIASDVETMIMESLSRRSTAAGVRELCYLCVLYIMRPRRGVMPYHPSDLCATNCLRSLEKATGEEGLPKALRDLCRVGFCKCLPIALLAHISCTGCREVCCHFGMRDWARCGDCRVNEKRGFQSKCSILRNTLSGEISRRRFHHGLLSDIKY
jgi:hypothetical protein